MPEMVILQVEHNASRVTHASQRRRPLRTIVNVQNVEARESPEQRPKPYPLLVAPHPRNSRRNRAGSPNSAGLMRKWIPILFSGRKSEDGDLYLFLQPAVDFISPASQCSTEVWAELLSPRKQHPHAAALERVPRTHRVPPNCSTSLFLPIMPALTRYTTAPAATTSNGREL